MTSTGSGADDGADGTSPGAPDSGTNRSRRRRRRQVHRRSAPPSQQARERAENLAASRPSPAEQQDAAPGPPSGTEQDGPRPSSTANGRNIPKTFHGSLPSAEDAPFVEITVAASGIHPSTSRMVAFSATLHSADGQRIGVAGNRPASADPNASALRDATGPEGAVTGIVQQINPGEDPGPWHLHGYTEADLGQAPGFATVASLLFDLIDGRTLICHNIPLTWGFIQYEYRRAQRAANRGNQRGGSRGRRRNQRRPKKIAVPVPERIIDTLGTARRQSVTVEDPRLRSIADVYVRDHGLDLPADALPGIGAASSGERADLVPDDILLADNRILFPLYSTQRDLAVAGGSDDNGPGGISVADPSDLTADRFGLQRSIVRVDATTSPRPFGNPGTPDSFRLVQGMEFVVSPDVSTDPDVLINSAMRAGLVYSEKLNRTSSLVVCNGNHPLRGKAMHGERKNIPLLTDVEFLGALDDVAPGSTDIKGADARPATPKIPAPQTGQGRGGGGRGRGGNRNGKGKGGNRGNRGGKGRGNGSGKGGQNNQGGQANQNKQGGQAKQVGKGSGQASQNRRRRRRGSGQNNNQKQG
ncbi:MAG: DNA polymerase III subunit epsilon [Mycobacteriaceae bacterium]|uniref:DNA polymerase III subunit epsilon n=1 Tax=Corynebacterium sp. TaxID=1720 RepID=UPI003F94E6FD